MISLSHCMFLSLMLFTIGLVGFLIRRNIIVVLMSLELVFNAANLNLVVFAYYLDSLHGQIFALFIITVAACEAALGLAILIALYRNFGSVNADEVDLMRW